MNEYQEALDFAKKHLDSKQDLEKVEVLQELVNKATPEKAKPMYLPLVSTPYRCPCCGALVKSEIEEFNYCHNCGQAIDWRNENDE